jgi:hypothetical protein
MKISDEKRYFLRLLKLACSHKFSIFVQNTKKQLMFTEKDLQQFKSKGIDQQTVENQINHFKSGFPYMHLSKPATPGDGLHSFSEEQIKDFETYFDDNQSDYEILKFVPASGAASRMFKHLLAFAKDFDGSAEAISKLEGETDFNSVGYFFQHLHQFAFYEPLKALIKKNKLTMEALLENKDYSTILDYLLTEKGLNYAQKPKALLYFHDYQDGPRRAFEEHLVEAAHYAKDENGVARVHFTVSPEHQNDFTQAVNDVKEKYEKKYNVRFEISFSQQKSSTDTLAVDMDNKPFRNKDGSILFRPGGHGALIENLNDLQGEIIFVKNIDNIVPDRLRDTTYLYKKAIAGLLFQLQEKTFEYLDQLDDGNLDDMALEHIKEFAHNDLNIFIPDAYEGYDRMERIDWLFNKLNRPMRIAGMVKNEGEPGGGPFWVINEDDEFSLQIVESSQIDFSNPTQKEIVGKATHFNPVDLVCGVRNFRGENFDLRNFVDPKTGFISQKSKDGRDLKAQELPGLWNGAMANWITIFVETPLITFNPVKTVNDLLRPQHQPE